MYYAVWLCTLQKIKHCNPEKPGEMWRLHRAIFLTQNWLASSWSRAPERRRRRTPGGKAWAERGHVDADQTSRPRVSQSPWMIWTASVPITLPRIPCPRLQRRRKKRRRKRLAHRRPVQTHRGTVLCGYHGTVIPRLTVTSAWIGQTVLWLTETVACHLCSQKNHAQKHATI